MNLFLIGAPIKHSLSPLIYSYWLEKYNIKGSYKAIGLTDDNFLSFVNDIKGSFAGGNITLPFKKKIIPYLDEIDNKVKKIGACNLIMVKDNKIIGSNTDSYGFSKSLKLHKESWDANEALVLGAGGASYAIIDSLIDLNFKKIYLTNRTYVNLLPILEHFKDKVIAIDWLDLSAVTANLDLIVNATSANLLSGSKSYDEIYPLNMALLPKKTLVADLTYSPLVPLFLKEAQYHELTIMNGLDMLLYQAEDSFYKWFDIRPEITKELKDNIFQKMQSR